MEVIFSVKGNLSIKTDDSDSVAKALKDALDKLDSLSIGNLQKGLIKIEGVIDNEGNFIKNNL